MNRREESQLAELLALKREWGCEFVMLRNANAPTAVLLQTHDMLKSIVDNINALNRKRFTRNDQ